MSLEWVGVGYVGVEWADEWWLRSSKSVEFSRSLKETAFCPADLFHSLVTDGINYAAQDTGE